METKIKKIIWGILVIFLFPIIIEAQNVVITDDDSYIPDNSAMLDIKSLDKGLLIPRMTQAQRDAIILPATALLIYQTDNNPGYYYYEGNWEIVGSASADNLGDHTATQNIQLNGNWFSNDGDNEGIVIDNSGNIGIGTTSPGGLLGLGDANTFLNVDGSNNFTFTDAVTGTKTLAQLALNSADFSNGGEAGGADRSLGNTDNYALSFKTNNTTHLKIQNDGGVRIDGNLGLYADPIPEGGVSMNNIYLYDAGTYSGPYFKISGHNEARILLESRRVGATSGNLWYLQSGGGADTYLDILSIYNLDEGTFLCMRDGKRIGLLYGPSEMGSGDVQINGNVGIGVTSPVNILDVEGNVVIGATYSGTNTAPTNGLLVEGNVGIGTTSPSSKLEVSGMIHSTSEGIKFPDGTVQTTASSSGSSNGIPIPVIFDDFDRDLLNATNNNDWSQSVSGNGTVLINSYPSLLSVSSGPGGSGSALVYGNRSFSVSDGTLIFKGKIGAYEDPGIYGDYQPRGLVNGTDRNNAIEFITASSTAVYARTVNNGSATQTLYNIGVSVNSQNYYMIVATSTEVKFYVNGNLAATHTTNIPTASLNAYLGTNYSGSGNVPIHVDFVSFDIIK
ncbi:MAG: hypothetical protein HQ565_03210 [Bacteroidetes bacterium]|nr:hypothetical protein [Bacteroidota bacterium]